MANFELRDYQKKALLDIKAAWSAGVRCVGLQLATGGGKTVIFSELLKHNVGGGFVIAHRNQLVIQASLALALNGVQHDLIASKPTRSVIMSIHRLHTGKCFYVPDARVVVCGIDTLLRRQDTRIKKATLVIIDEGHHVLRKNKWGAVLQRFTGAKILLPSATPERADGSGLGASAAGFIETLIETVPMRTLVEQGYLSDYKIIAPPQSINTSRLEISSSGDYSPRGLATAAQKSTIVGDVVAHYLKFARGKLGLTFVTDLITAANIAAQYNAQGVPAEVICAKTDELTRAKIMEKFKKRELMQLVNVDILGEGVDVPAIEAVSMARPTESYALYCQQFGRGMRAAPLKTHAVIIDHVGNVKRHGLPDAPRTWSLADKQRRAQSDEMTSALKLTSCLNSSCFAVYARYLKKCPHCGYAPVPASRAAPEFVDGDLIELDPQVLKQMRNEVARIDKPALIPKGVSLPAKLRIERYHVERQKAQKELRTQLKLWAGFYKHNGYSDSEIYRLFYLTHGVDMLTAQTLGVKEAHALQEKLIKSTDDAIHITRDLPELKKKDCNLLTEEDIKRALALDKSCTISDGKGLSLVRDRRNKNSKFFSVWVFRPSVKLVKLGYRCRKRSNKRPNARESFITKIQLGALPVVNLKQARIKRDAIIKGLKNLSTNAERVSYIASLRNPLTVGGVLSDKDIAACKIPDVAKRKYRFGDGKSLFVLVTRKSKTFESLFRQKNKQFVVKLGEFPELSLEEARKRNLALRALGITPEEIKAYIKRHGWDKILSDYELKTTKGENKA